VKNEDTFVHYRWNICDQK